MQSKAVKGAIVSLGMLCLSGSAYGATSMGVKGYVNWYVGYADQDAMNNSGNTNPVDVMGDVELHMKGETVMENGIKAGLFLLFNGGTVAYNPETDAEVKFSYVYLESPFGKIMLGLQDNVGKQVYYGATDVGVFGVNGSEVFNFIAQRPLNRMEDARINPRSRRNQISYISPKINGVQMGVSYLPGSNLDTDDNTLDRLPDFKSAVVAAITYDVEIFGRLIGVSGGASKMERADGDRYEYGFGLRWMTMWDVFIGGGMKIRHTEQTPGKNPYIWNVSVGYEGKERSVSFAFQQGKDANPVAGGGFDTKLWMLSGRHTIVTGTDAFMTLAYTKERGNFSGDIKTAQTKIAVAGISLSF